MIRNIKTSEHKDFFFCQHPPGRVVEIIGEIPKKISTSPRSSGLNQLMPALDLPEKYKNLVSRGHYIGLFLGGPETIENSFLQNAIINSGAYQAAELEALHYGQSIHLSIHYIDDFERLSVDQLIFFRLDSVVPLLSAADLAREMSIYKTTPRLVEYAITHRDNPYKESVYRLPNPLLSIELAAQHEAMKAIQQQKHILNKIRPKSLDSLLIQLPDLLETYRTENDLNTDNLLMKLVNLASCKKRTDYFRWYLATPHDDVREFLYALAQAYPDKADKSPASKLTVYLNEQYRQAVGVFEAIDREAIGLAVPELLEKYNASTLGR